MTARASKMPLTEDNQHWMTFVKGLAPCWFTRDEGGVVIRLRGLQRAEYNQAVEQLDEADGMHQWAEIARRWGATVHRYTPPATPPRVRPIEAKPDEHQAYYAELTRRWGAATVKTAYSCWVGGGTTRQVAAAAGISQDTARVMLRYFRSKVPERAKCASCDRPRDRGLHVERGEGGLLCAFCYRLVVTERANSQQIVALYNEGLNREQIAKDLAVHARTVNGALSYFRDELQTTCAHPQCGRERRASVAFGVGLYAGEDGHLVRKATCRACLKRAGDGAVFLADGTVRKAAALAGVA